MTQHPILQVRGLRKYYDITRGLFSRVVGHVHAVEDVSFDVGRREVLGLAGESGSGKTTIGRAVLRLVEPSAGEIIFDGKDVLGFDKAATLAFRRAAQIIFQDPYASINPTMTVGQAIAEPLRVQKIASGSELADRVAQLLTDVSLPVDFARRRPRDLSGGQRQRVVIARARSGAALSRRRRAGVGARCLDPGADHQPASPRGARYPELPAFNLASRGCTR